MPRWKSQSVLERISRFITKTSYCWMWNGAVGSGGYGAFSTVEQDGKPAHRVMYELSVGSIEDGMTIDHLCKNRLCVNPEHMEVVTYAENMRRRTNTKLSYSAVEEIKALYSNGKKQKEIAAMFNINPSSVSRVVNGKRWGIL